MGDCAPCPLGYYQTDKAQVGAIVAHCTTSDLLSLQKETGVGAYGSRYAQCTLDGDKQSPETLHMHFYSSRAQGAVICC